MARITFAGDRVVMEDDGTMLIGAYRLDPDARPKAFDLIASEGGEEVAHPLGIYALDSGESCLCFSFPTKDRPTEFATYPGSCRTPFICERAPSLALSSRLGYTDDIREQR